MQKAINHPTIQELPSLGKIPPYELQFEEAVLGALLIEKEAFIHVEPILEEEDFYLRQHQLIYKAILNLSALSKPIDMLTITEELRRMNELENIGGPVYIAALADKVASGAHILYHAQVIKQKAIARKLIILSSHITSMAYDPTQDVDEILEHLEKSLSDVTSNNTGAKSIDMQAALKKAIDKAYHTQQEKQSGRITAIPTGLFQLNREFSGGWKSPDLIILGARPSMGKTQHALSFAKAAAKAGMDCLFVSIEMSATQLVNRFLLEDDRINSYNLQTGQMSQEEWNAVDYKASEYWNLPLHIADSHNIRYLKNIKSEARRLFRQGKLKLLIIDYLGLIKTNMKFQNRYQEIGYITGELKSLAKELEIPIILLSQLNRPAKGAEARLPKLEDLRESGDIEQDADIVLFIHKPDYYKHDAVDEHDGTPWTNRGMLIIAKYREGARNHAIIFHHDDRYKKIFDYKQPKKSDVTYDRYMEPERDVPF